MTAGPTPQTTRASAMTAPSGATVDRLSPAATPRLAALDWMRGLVMILMTVDHASGEFNAGRLMTDGPTLYHAGTPLPAAQFLTRWMTHLCAPTFVFLAGTALALSVDRRRAAGEPAAVVDGFLLRRGLLIAALDPLWMSWVLAPGLILFQVLYAIGGSLVAMVLLRRIDVRWLAAGALVVVLGGEALIGGALAASGGTPNLAVALLLTGGQFGRLVIAYPLVPWLAIMVLGWCFGRVLPTNAPATVARRLVVAGAAALVLFLAVRGANGYGNLLLPRDDGSIVQWLHVSKYPPSLAYVALELGLMAVVLAAFMARARRNRTAEIPVLLVLGQTALFYYLLHVHLLALGATVSGLEHRGGLASTYVATLATVAVLYPLCVWYRGYKAAHPTGWPRYV